MTKKSTKNKPKVMVAGHLCLDITPIFPDSVKRNVNDLFTPGRLTNIGDAVLSTGGAVSNTGLALARLGVDVFLNGKIGCDEFGDIIRKIVGKQRSRSFKMVSDQRTSYTIVLAPPGVDRFVLHNPATNDTFGPEDIDYELARECVLFHFGYPPLMKRMYENDGLELAEVFKRIKELGLTTSLDMAMPDPSSRSGQVDWMKILENALPYVDLFEPSIEEITYMLDRELFEKRKIQAGDNDPINVYEPEDCTNISSILLSLGVKVVAIKCGIRGLYLRTASKTGMQTIGTSCPKEIESWSNRELWASTFKADNFQSALGAGDATIAGFLLGIIKSFTPEHTLQIANIVGWQNVQVIDAISGIKNWPDTLKLIKEKERERNPISFESNGWLFSDKEKTYSGPNDKVKF